MHELASMEALVHSILEECGEMRVLTVRLQVGTLAAVQRDALHFRFDDWAKGTPLEGACGSRSCKRLVASWRLKELEAV